MSIKLSRHISVPFLLNQKGHQLPPVNKPYDYVLAARGIYKRVSLWFVECAILVQPIQENLQGLLLDEFEEYLNLRVPRIKRDLFDLVVQISREEIDVEVMFNFRFDDGVWVISRPHQEQRAARVRFSRVRDPKLVVDLHSHNTMPAFFSPTDDDDENEERFYVVIGALDKDPSEIVVRLGINGHWVAVPATVLFEDIGDFQDNSLNTLNYSSFAYIPPAEAPAPGFRFAGLEYLRHLVKG
jgi:PRTRC genetic system protein A